MSKKVKLLLWLMIPLLAAGIIYTILNKKEVKPSAGKDVTIVGFSQLGSESGWRVGNSRDVIAAAQRAGIELIYDNADQKQEEQIKAIRSFIAYQVDVIVLAPIVEEGWENVLQEARDAGIPVLLSDRYISIEDESLFAGYVGSDFLEEGRAAARFLQRKAETSEEVRIVEIAGTQGSTPAKQRAIGFRDVLSENSKYHIVRSISGDFLRSKGKECMVNILKEIKDIDVLYSHNDAMTLGAIEAIEEAGLVPGKDITIITIDGEQGAIDLLKAGKINCVVECTPMLGDMIMDLAQKLAEGKTIPRVSHPKEQVFSQFDANMSQIPPRGY